MMKSDLHLPRSLASADSLYYWLENAPWLECLQISFSFLQGFDMKHEVVDLFNCYLKMLSNFSGFAALNSFDLFMRFVHLT